MRRVHLQSIVPLLFVSSVAFAQSSSAVTQKFASALNFAAPIVGSIGALAVIGGVIAKAAGQAPIGNGAIGGGVLFIIATFLMKTYGSWVTLFQ